VRGDSHHGDERIPRGGANLKRGASPGAVTQPGATHLRKEQGLEVEGRFSWQPGKPGERDQSNGKEEADGDESSGALRGEKPLDRPSGPDLRVGQRQNPDREARLRKDDERDSKRRSSEADATTRE
jgi:hypothetical protein